MLHDIARFMLRFRPVKENSQPSKAPPVETAGTRSESDDIAVEYLSMSGEKITAPRLGQILQSAEQGNPQEQASLISMIYDREPVVLAHMRTRIQAVLGCRWKVEAVEEDDTDDKFEKVLASELRRLRVHSLMRHLLDAVGTGYSGARLDWLPGGHAGGFTPVHPSNWVFDMGGNPGLWTTGGEKSLASFHPHQFVFHRHQTRPGIPSRTGLVRSLVWLWLFKHNAWRDRARFLEKFGIPFLVAQISQADFNNSTQKAAIKESLRRIGSDGVAVTTEGSEIATVNPSGQSNNADYHQFCRDVDDIYAYLILGQSGTSGGTPGKLGNETAQENVRLDILEADCMALMETIDAQVLDPLAVYLGGEEKAGKYKFCLEYEPGEDMQAKATLVKTLKEAGFSANAEWVEKTFDIPVTENATTAPFQGPSQGGQLADFADSSPSPLAVREEFVARLTDNTLEKLFRSTEAMAEFYRPLQGEIRKIYRDIDPEDPELVAKFADASKKLFEKYPAIYETMDSAAFEDIMRGSMLAALVKGNFSSISK